MTLRPLSMGGAVITLSPKRDLNTRPIRARTMPLEGFMTSHQEPAIGTHECRIQDRNFLLSLGRQAFRFSTAGHGSRYWRLSAVRWLHTWATTCWTADATFDSRLRHCSAVLLCSPAAACSRRWVQADLASKNLLQCLREQSRHSRTRERMELDDKECKTDHYQCEHSSRGWTASGVWSWQGSA